MKEVKEVCEAIKKVCEVIKEYVRGGKEKRDVIEKEAEGEDGG